MSRKMKFVWTLAALALGAISTAQMNPTYVSDEIYVKFERYSNGRELSASMKQFLLGKAGGAVQEELRQIGWTRVKLKPGATVTAAVNALKNERLVRTAEPVYIYQLDYVPFDPLFNQQKWLVPMNVTEGWDLFKGIDTSVIAILDTGCDSDHEDLINKYVPGHDLIDGDDDPDDIGGHGTGSAGMAAADTDNGVGVSSPGFNAMIMPLRVGEGQGITKSVEGILYAADNGANIISMSYGGGFPSQAQQDACNYAYGLGVILGASAGNSNLKDTKFYPAGHDNVVSVGASDDFDNRAGFSNYGDWVQIAAPGVNTLTTANGGGYGGFGGTSAACPAAMGLTALVHGFAPSGTSNTQIIQWVKDGCEDIGDWVKEGRVDAGNSLALVPKYVEKDYPIVGMQVLLGSLESGAPNDIKHLDSTAITMATQQQTSLRSPGTFFSATFDVSADQNEIDSIQITLNAFATGSRVTQMLYGYDQIEQRWRFLRAFPASTTSASTDQVAKVSNAQRYIAPDGTLSLGMRAIQPSAYNSSGFRWIVDRVGISAKLLLN
ncbi:MAG: S8 family serine peptidase [Fimbriimonadaceae bacterium]|nr:S8 family serine peptidase [Fimbriimonadaceae bacterium]